jgi:putative two-component system response regulator
MKQKNYEILLVDDRKENLELLGSFLADKGYKVRSALNGKMALMTIYAKMPDLVLLDIEMPGMDGYEVCQELKKDEKTKNLPIIFVSAHNDVEAKINAFKMGGVDYITKPFANEEVVARVKMHLALSEYQHLLENRVQESLEEIQHLNAELELTQNEMIMTLSSIMETRDDDTGNHVLKVAEYTKILATHYGLDPKTVDTIYKAAPFHDAGKVAIPDNVLNKPAKLTPSEREIMQTHSLRGYEIFKDAKTPILKMAAIIAKEHHEYYNGKGYPQGLKGEQIHIAGRLVIVADVFDALVSERVYKKAWRFEDAVAFISSQRGEMFEPKIVDIFLAHQEEFLEVYKRLQD